MAKRAVSASEIQIASKRLERIAGQLLLAGAMKRPEIKAKLFETLGYELKEDGKLWLKKDGTKSMEQTYLDEYKKCSKLLENFYKVLAEFPNEKLKFVAELRYVDGYAWNEIALRLNESLPTLYGYRSIILKKFRDENLECVISMDKDCD